MMSEQEWEEMWTETHPRCEVCHETGCINGCCSDSMVVPPSEMGAKCPARVHAGCAAQWEAGCVPRKAVA